MNKFIKGFSVVVLVGLVSFFVWTSNNKQEPLSAEEVMKTMKGVKIEGHPIGFDATKSKPKQIFNKIKTLEQLELYKKQAIKDKKILMVYFYTNGCYYCEKMKNITFSDSRVQTELAKNYITVSINYSEHKEAFKPNFTLHATPAIFFFDQEGKSISEDAFYGYQGAEDFFNKIELLAEPF
jgi:thioredoxin-related protein